MSGLLNFKYIEEYFGSRKIKTLTDSYSVSGGFDLNVNNLLMEGENYFCLDFLIKQNKKFDTIYIDPPYNTGSKDFKYNDKYVESDDPDKHSRWLSFMDNRLKLAKNLLSESGCLILSIGEDEVHHIALLLKNHFNFVSEPIIWLSKALGNNNKTGNITNICTEFVFIAYDDKNFKTIMEEVDLDEKSEFAVKKIKRYPLGIFLKNDLENYELREFNGKKCRIIPKSDYTIAPYNENSFKGHRFQKRSAQKGHGAYGYKLAYDCASNDIDGDFLMVIDGVKDKQGLGVKFQHRNNYFQSVPANKMKVRMPNFLGYYQGGYKNFQTAKPVELIKRLIRNTTPKNGSVLDFFAGTGTSMVAVNELNKLDGFNMSCCIITNNENNICDDFTVVRLLNNGINFKKITVSI